MTPPTLIKKVRDWMNKFPGMVRGWAVQSPRVVLRLLGWVRWALFWLPKRVATWLDKLSTRSPGAVAVGVGVVTIAVATLTWKLRVGFSILPRNVITLRMTSDFVEFRLVAPWELRPEDSVSLSKVKLDDLGSVDISETPETLDLPEKLDGARMEIGSCVTLTRLTLDSGSVIRVKRNGAGGVQLSARLEPVSGTLVMRPRTIVRFWPSEDGGKPQIFPGTSETRTVSFTRNSSTAWMDLQVSVRDTLLMTQAPIDSIAFVEFIGESRLIRPLSKVKQATLVLTDVADTIPLEQGAHLSLAGSRKRFVADLRADRDSVQLKLRGKVPKILVGPAPYQENVAPRLIEYWLTYLKVLGGVAISLAGALWGLRKLPGKGAK